MSARRPGATRARVRGDGSTTGRCEVSGQALRMLSSVAQGIPITCRISYEANCIQCIDVYGAPAVDNCRAEVLQGEGTIVDQPVAADNPEQQPAPPGAGAGACDAATAELGFVSRLNALLKSEGFKFSFAPPAAGQQDAIADFFARAQFDNQDNVCGTDVGDFGRTECDEDAEAQGRCFCEEQEIPILGGVSCRCARMTARVLEEACGAVPQGCDAREWGKGLWQAYSAASQWLNGQLIPNVLGGAKTIASAEGPGDVICRGSPLVLDLAGDGVELGPVEDGVRFDLFGHGALQTAWVRGADDALLVLDRDGDGRVDSGAELFGEGSTLAGQRAADGFAALAVLDTPARGGDGNGLVDRRDLMFARLALWRDANHDGVSQPGELASLDALGVAALAVQGRSAGRLRDAHGNDLSLRASYHRADGSAGLLVDALFVTRAR